MGNDGESSIGTSRLLKHEYPHQTRAARVVDMRAVQYPNHGTIDLSAFSSSIKHCMYRKHYPRPRGIGAMTKAELDQYTYVQCHNRDHTRCAANGVGCVRLEMIEKSVVLTALDEKDALIADLIGYIERIQWTDAEAVNIEKLKARAR
jgi:hypothetical protein